MTRWNLQETRNHVERIHGEVQLRIVRNCLKSVVDRQRFARYHFQEYRRLLATHIDDKLKSKSIYEITLIPDDNESDALELCLTQVCAHIIACLQSMHSLADILSHTAYFSLGLNVENTTLKEHQINIESVSRSLSTRPNGKALSRLLQRIYTDISFDYLRALVNHSKHRSIVGTVLSVGPQSIDEPPYRLLFDEFEYRGASYFRQEVALFLEPTYAWFSQEIVDFGNALNTALAEDCDAAQRRH